MNDRDKLEAAFTELRGKGFEAHARFWCCQSCGCAALEEDVPKYIFWHDQDDVRAFGLSEYGYRRTPQITMQEVLDEETRRYELEDVEEEEEEDLWKSYNFLQDTLHLSWGTNSSPIKRESGKKLALRLVATATEAVEVLRRHGLDAHWSGDITKRIEVRVHEVV